MTERKLLTIAIPTYNRSGYLDLCLSKLCAQAKPFEKILEILVSNNNSSDDTESVVQKYRDDGCQIKYRKNEGNIGSGANVIKCFEIATSTYVLIMGDDDFLVEGALERIVNVLNNNSIGVLYLSAYPYIENYVAEKAELFRTDDLRIYDDLTQFFARVSFNLTFISSVVVRKDFVDPDVDIGQFEDSFLPQLSWTYSVLFNPKNKFNAVLNQHAVAARTDNSGGYPVCEVFATNLTTISDYFIGRGVDAKYFDIIHSRLIKNYFPSRLLELRDQSGNFLPEDYLVVLRSSFSRYISFWFYLYPIIVLPIVGARLWRLLTTPLIKWGNFYRIFVDARR